MSTFTSGWFISLAAVALAHLVLNALEVQPWTTATKILLAPLLAAWVISVGGPPLLIAALIACFFGDLFLELDPHPWFLIGMGSFAVAQVIFIVWLVEAGAFERLGNRWWLLVAFLIVFAGLIALIWRGLEPALRIPVPIYGLLLVATTTLAISTDFRIGLGSALFLFSDAMIALRIADVVDGSRAIVSLAIMSTYIAAIWLLTIGIVDYEASPKSATSTTPQINSQRI